RGTPDFSADADCLDEVAYGTDPARGNRLSDPLLIAPFTTLTPDLRPGAGSAASLGGVGAPANGFFVTALAYIGAVEPANGPRSNVPWYAGWTRAWSPEPNPADGIPDPTLLPKATGQSPDLTAYAGLNVPSQPAGYSYQDPVTGVKVWKVTSATVPAPNTGAGHD